MSDLTKEKWRVNQPDGQPPYLVLTTEEPIPLESVAYVGGESVQVFQKRRTPEEVRRIACLIAAAPELLAACRHVLYRIEHAQLCGGQERRMIRDAIAKAEGGAA